MMKDPRYRIAVGTILLFYVMVINTLDGLSWYSSNPTVMVALIGFASTLITVGIIKEHKSFKNV